MQWYLWVSQLTIINISQYFNPHLMRQMTSIL